MTSFLCTDVADGNAKKCDKGAAPIEIGRKIAESAKRTGTEKERGRLGDGIKQTGTYLFMSSMLTATRLRLPRLRLRELRLRLRRRLRLRLRLRLRRRRRRSHRHCHRHGNNM